MKLPEAFTARMQGMLGSEFEAFIAAYDRLNTSSLRLNRMKLPIESFLNESFLPCLSHSVPWETSGRYYEVNADIRPGKHPYHDAGLYYIQEASAMLPASLCPPIPGDKVLDLCAAPGGKATQLAAALNGEGLLVANEIHPQRAAILSQNIERMGIRNAIITCHAPDELVEHFPSFFNKIVVDAPCSGEGMFRKEEQALTMWSQNNVELCAERQKEILESAAKLLAPDGYLTYSTCTFSPEENEGVVLSFLKSHPEFEVVEPINPTVLNCIEEGLIDRGNPDWITHGNDCAERLRRTIRIFPHHTNGEGHFAALLHKSSNAIHVSPAKRGNDYREKYRNESDVKLRPLLDKAVYLFEQFIENVSDEYFTGAPCLFGEQLYFSPHQIPSPQRGLRILRQGLHLGTIKGGNRFEPSHALALALNVTRVNKTFAVDYDTALSYLHGEVLPCGEESGWYIITFNGFSLGWGKASNGVMKNHYPKGLRKSF